MKSKAMYTRYFISMFILLVTITTMVIPETHAQGLSINNDSIPEIKGIPLENNINISIITPWNTGNDRNISGSIDRNG